MPKSAKPKKTVPVKTTKTFQTNTAASTLKKTSKPMLSNMKKRQAK